MSSTVLSKMTSDDAKRSAVNYIWGKHFSRKIGNTLILPSNDPAEINTAISHGVRKDQLFMCDSSTGVLASCMKKSGWSSEEKKALLPNRKAMYSSDFFEYLAQRKVSLDIAHLDYCSFLSDCEHGTYSEIYKFGYSGIMTDGIVAINVLKGRERGDIGAQVINTSRLEVVREALNRGLADSPVAFKSQAWIVDSDWYFNVSTNTSMQWTVFSIKPNRKRLCGTLTDKINLSIGSQTSDNMLAEAALKYTYENASVEEWNAYLGATC